MNSMRKIVVFLMAALMLAALHIAKRRRQREEAVYSLDTMSVPPGQTTAPFTVEGHDQERRQFLHPLVQSLRAYWGDGRRRDQPGTGNATITPLTFTPVRSVTVTKVDVLKSGDSRTLTIKVNSCGDWPVECRRSWTGAKLNGQPFNLVPAHFQPLHHRIPCGRRRRLAPAFNVYRTASIPIASRVNGGTTTATAAFSRSRFLSIYVTNTVPTNGHLHFRWPDDQTRRRFACGVRVRRSVRPVAAADESQVLQVAWLNDGGRSGKEPGDSCVYHRPGRASITPTSCRRPMGSTLDDAGTGRRHEGDSSIDNGQPRSATLGTIR